MDEEDLRMSVARDILNADSPEEFMSICCCAYYSVWCKMDEDKRKILDKCAKSVRTSSLKEASKQSKPDKDGYIVEE